MLFVLLVNNENYGIEEEVSAEASISHVKSCSVNKIAAGSLGDVKFQDAVETEHEHRNLVARKTESDADEEATLASSRQIWTGLFRTVFTDIQFSVKTDFYVLLQKLNFRICLQPQTNMLLLVQVTLSVKDLNEQI